MPDPVLSVVVTVVDGGEALSRCLRALVSQAKPPSLEILVPYDSTLPSVPAIVDEIGVAAGDGVRLRALGVGRLATRRSPHSAAGQHELIDQRRAKGLTAAGGDIVAIVEDRGVPRPDWAAAVAAAHARLPHAVIGGAVENARDRVLNWAVYFCDFGRYRLPFEAGPRPYVTDVNVSYKRSALDRTRDVWTAEYHEPLVHWTLEQAGETLFLSPDFVVDQMRDDLGVWPLLRERFVWGRLFGALRARGAPAGRRLLLATLAPFLPPLLFARVVRDQLVRRGAVRQVLVAAPAVLLLQIAWALGETTGYLTRRS